MASLPTVALSHPRSPADLCARDERGRLKAGETLQPIEQVLGTLARQANDLALHIDGTWLLAATCEVL